MVPTDSMTCLALVRPGSRLARRCGAEMPAYGIYEHSRGRGERELRFGDGSGIGLSIEDHEDLVLLVEFDQPRIDQLGWFDG